jgi:hypothetical protein
MFMGTVNYAIMMHVAVLEADVAAARVRWHGIEVEVLSVLTSVSCCDQQLHIVYYLLLALLAQYVCVQRTLYTIKRATAALHAHLCNRGTAACA